MEFVCQWDCGNLVLFIKAMLRTRFFVLPQVGTDSIRV